MMKIFKFWAVLGIVFLLFSCNNINTKEHDGEKDVALAFTKSTKLKLDYAYNILNLDIEQIKMRVAFIQKIRGIAERNPIVAKDQNYIKLLAIGKIYNEVIKKHPALIQQLAFINAQNSLLAESIIDNKYNGKKGELKHEMMLLKKDTNSFMDQVNKQIKPAKEVDLLYNRLDKYFDKNK